MKHLATTLQEQGVKRHCITRLHALYKLLLGELSVRTALGEILMRHHGLLPQLP